MSFLLVAVSVRLYYGHHQAISTTSSAPHLSQGKTWRELAARSGGPDNYRFGDISRALFKRQQKPPSEEPDNQSFIPDVTILYGEMARLRSDLDKCELRCNSAVAAREVVESREPLTGCLAAVASAIAVLLFMLVADVFSVPLMPLAITLIAVLVCVGIQAHLMRQKLGIPDPPSNPN